jgi:2-hydroxy-3-oxopropionate reductase
MKIGFIGLGIMGAPMAGHLLAGGHEMFVRTRSKVPEGLQAATKCASGADVARAADVIFLMLPDTPDVELVLFGKDGVASGLAKGKTVIDMSSIDPIATRGFAQKIKALGCDYLDAPVSGGEVGAKAASLTIMVGGEPAAFERVKPLFQLMGKNITLVGGAGDGQVCKVANQIIVALNIAAVGEALVFASKAGADPARVREALMGGFASSRILEVHGERMIKRTFNPGFRIALHQKDLNLALQGARALGVALPQTASAAQLMQSCTALGLGQSDHSALVKALENMAQHKVMPDAPAA